jgi:GTP-binding protein
MLLYRVQEMLDSLPPREKAIAPAEDWVAMEPPVDEKAFEIYSVTDGQWRVVGVAIERAAQMTNWDYYEAAMRFQRILRAMGVADALVEAGVQEGDTVTIGDVELVWGYENALD